MEIIKAQALRLGNPMPQKIYFPGPQDDAIINHLDDMIFLGSGKSNY